jgi:hypothetical protein
MKFSSGILPGSTIRRVTIKCPQSGDTVPTGITMDEEAFRNVTLRYELACPKCGQRHLWTKDDAFLE